MESLLTHFEQAMFDGQGHPVKYSTHQRWEEKVFLIFEEVHFTGKSETFYLTNKEEIIIAISTALTIKICHVIVGIEHD